MRAYAASLGAKVSVSEHVLASVADATGWGVEMSVWALAIVCLAASRRLQQTCLFINVDLCLLKESGPGWH